MWFSFPTLQSNSLLFFRVQIPTQLRYGLGSWFSMTAHLYFPILPLLPCTSHSIHTASLLQVLCAFSLITLSISSTTFHITTPACVLTLYQCCASKEKYHLIGPGIYILCLQLVEQFAEVIEPIRCGALLEEVPHWGQAWKVYPLGPLPVLLLCLLYVFEMWSLGFLLLDAMSPCQMDTYYSGMLGQNKLFVVGGGGKMLWGQGFYCCKSKVLIVVLTLSDHILAMMFSMMMFLNC